MAKSHYLSNNEFTKLVLKYIWYRSRWRTNPVKYSQYTEIQDKLYYSIQLLVKNILRGTYWLKADKEDTEQEAIILCMEKIHMFKKNKGKAFNYATTIIMNYIKQAHRSTMNYEETKVRYGQHLLSKENKVHYNHKPKLYSKDTRYDEI